ncbi:hypothetical protein MY04_4221 [Flammeovirga sp. MY04]|uniref:carbohydrate binding domain-containing protein n=1 Tax=Flammeovirga sp. MY04 TaxID=1191459 RepID=UPI00080621C7|nr:carbohydrate binding domain-containing protein [Flammeovirga sp. MY04]ANQ51563.1 hypothetical protein MY04_4221 [Flammeovirga sp. MY04]
MKLLKNICVGAMAFAAALTSCQKDDVVPHGDFQDVAIFSSYQGQITVEVNNQIAIADGSKGYSSRKWSIPAPNYFINNNDSVLDEETAYVKFMEVGDVPLKIEWQFPDSTGIRDHDSLFIVNVLDTITTKLAVTKVEGNYSVKDGKYVIEAGSIVIMTDTSSGSPDTFEWLLEGEDESLDTKTIEVQYKKLGKFDVGLVSSRVEPFGRPDSLVMVDFIEVIPSTLPVLMTEANEISLPGVVQLQFSREMNVVDETQIAAFNVKVNGTDDAVIKSIQLNPADASIIELHLEQDLLNSQTATVSYDASVGTVESSDFVALETFTDETVNIYLLNLLTVNTNFEDGTITPFGEPYNINGNTYLSNISTDAQSGSNSMMAKMDASTNSQIAQNTGFFKIEKGKTYAFEFWVKVNSNPGGNNLEMTWRMQPAAGWSDGYKQWLGSCCTDALKPENEGTWQKITILTDKQAPEDWEEAKLHLQIGCGGAGEVEVLFDNFKFFEYEVPPAN